MLFEEVALRQQAKAKPVERQGRAQPETPKETRRVRKLEHELAATKEYLQSLIEDHDRTNDDLGSANEELVSGNEELQSMNEELETAKEELQSTNEELTTVNDELHSRNQEVGQINSDLVNLLSTVDIPILILDTERRIRRFTPKARSILNVLPSDVGRPLDDIKPNLDVPDLRPADRRGDRDDSMQESEVQDRDGRWYRMQIRPYKTIGQQDRRRHLVSRRHRRAEAPSSARRSRRKRRPSGRTAPRTSSWRRCPTSCERRCPAMLMHAQLLRRGEHGCRKVKRAGEAIERGTRMQVQLIDDLLDVSRIVTGKLRIEFRPVDLCAVIRAALEGVSAPAERKSIKLKVELGRDRREGLRRSDAPATDRVEPAHQCHQVHARKRASDRRRWKAWTGSARIR